MWFHEGLKRKEKEMMNWARRLFKLDRINAKVVPVEKITTTEELK